MEYNHLQIEQSDWSIRTSHGTIITYHEISDNTAQSVYIGGRKRGMQRGIPNKLMNEDNRARKIHPSLLLSVEEAVEQYAGHLSEPCVFGTDPLELNYELKEIRQKSFCSKYSFESLFCEVSNGCGNTFKNALLYLIDITCRLSHTDHSPHMFGVPAE